MATHISNPPSVIEYKGLKFVIFDAPNDDNAPAYLRELQKHNVTKVVRACGQTYKKEVFENAGITVNDWSFPDGAAPSEKVIQDWINLLKTVNREKEAVGVHCVAGLGRAPVLVAIALIEEGMEPLSAVSYIRSARRGSINQTQLEFLRDYRRSRDKCIVM